MDILRLILLFVAIGFFIRFCSEDYENNSNENIELEREIGMEMDSEIPKTFHGYNCLEDCSGHEAGYEWAEENDIDDVGDCDGNSNSFNEGCEAYVEENY